VLAARSLLLCFDFDCDVGLEFHGEVVGEDGDLLDELFVRTPYLQLADWLSVKKAGS